MHRIYQKHQPVLGNPQTRVGRVYIFAAMKKNSAASEFRTAPAVPCYFKPNL